MANPPVFCTQRVSAYFHVSHRMTISTNIHLPWLRKVTKRLKSCVYNFYSFVNLKIIFQNTRRIKSYFPYKDRLSRSQRSKVIYKAGCWNCDEFYIGKTKRRLHDRKTEHFKALADHVKTTGHDIKWDHFDILASRKTDFHCKIKETLFIQELKSLPLLLVLVVRSWCFISFYSSLCQHRITYCCRSFFSQSRFQTSIVYDIYIVFKNCNGHFWKCMLTSIRNVKSYKNALEYNVYHRCLCYFLNQATMA